MKIKKDNTNELVEEILKSAKPCEEPQRGPIYSIIELIACPDSFHGKGVRVIGFVNLAHEGTAIYLSSEDYKNRISKNGLWLEITPELWTKYAECNDKYVLVEGIYNSKHLGHMGLFSGAIQEITRFEVWPLAQVNWDKSGRPLPK